MRKVGQHYNEGRFYGELHDNGIAHDESREKSGVGLVEGIVKGARAQHHSNWSTTDLGDNA
jgi:hypothetical protein